MEAANFFAIYVLFFGDFRCFRQVYLGKSFDILQDWGMKGCPNFAGFSFFASGFRQVVRSTKHVHTCAVTYLETTTFWKSDATTYFLLNRRLMEACKIFLLQSVVKPDLDIHATASYANAVQLR